MIVWILIMSTYHGGISQVEFKTPQECVKSGDAVKKAIRNQGQSFYTFCMEVRK